MAIATLKLQRRLALSLSLVVFAIGHVGVSHGVELDGSDLFFATVGLLGGPAPVRRFLPELIDLIMSDQIDPGVVFDLELPLEQAAEGYQAMDECRATKMLLTL